MPILAIVLAYLLGSIPFGYLLVKWKTGVDVRASGSGNIGATNVLRTSGRAAGVLTLLLDAAKGWLALWLAGRLTDHNTLCLSAAAVAVMAGHIFTVFLRFKGGKGVATFVGVFLYLTPVALAAVTLVFFVAVGLTRFISLGSILSALTFPLAVWIISHAPWPVFAAALISSCLVLYRHRENILRLHAGTENVFSFGGNKPARRAV